MRCGRRRCRRRLLRHYICTVAHFTKLKVWEKKQKIVLEANQVLLWSVLAGAGVSLDIRGFGSVFDALE